MSEDDAMVDEFFSEVNDKYYPQVVEGLEQLDFGLTQDGIEVLSRPLHTIKGVTGFMAGFEYASSFTHKVEDFMKKVQSGEVPADPSNIAVLSEAVNMIFQVLEQLRDTGQPDEGETQRIQGLIREATEGGGGDAGPEAAGVEVEEKDGVTVIHIKDRRVHFEPHRKPITSAIIQAGAGTPVLMDMSEVLTFNSSSWEAIAELVGIFDISVCCLSASCKDVFYSWAFDRTIAAFEDEQAFFKGREQRQ
ncbi:Hpt domain-containing protein [Desulfovibrio oxyclinae]|uniref:Hpt domain-containing protein n=1 Tax=Desulfovibrio oxyclinae TaxID=63560 RepID=UPI0003A56907|nr:Hpt domain-containing protein [Desulfovibrio oxyclinae]